MSDLQSEFPGRNGFSAQNLWLMRQFHVEYCGRPNLQPLVREISWAKNLVIMARCKDDMEREFYLRATARFGWTKAVLQHQVDNKTFEKYLLNQTSFDQTLTPVLRAQAALAVKDRYTFDFLDLAAEHSERELELGLSWVTSTASKSADRSISSTSCCSTAVCALWWPLN